jgi:phenylpyruvate tautomerase PptA (4-oxalocrotonate tautomerase family)
MSSKRASLAKRQLVARVTDVAAETDICVDARIARWR